MPLKSRNGTASSLAPKPLPALKAAALKAGDRVALVSPGSRPESPSVLHRCVQVIEQLDMTPVVGTSAMKTHGFMAGTDKERLADLNGFIDDQSIKAIFCTTGGFGALHLLTDLNYEGLAKSPKIIAGCDDNTSLLNAITSRTGLVTFHAPNLDQVNSRLTFDRLKNMLTGKGTPDPIDINDNQDGDNLRWSAYSPVAGEVEGHLLGGNLTAFVSLLGTPFQPVVHSAVLFLEDKNEQFGILDRWFTTLYIGGYLQAVSGVALGAFENCDRKGSVNMLSVEDTFSDRLKMLGKPSCFGMPFGQTKNTSVIPLNIKCRFNSGSGHLEFAESALA